MIPIPSDAEIGVALVLVVPLAVAVLIGILTASLVIDWWGPKR